MIKSQDVFRVFEPHRGKAIVTTSGTSGRNWPDASKNPERDISMGSAMGQTTSAAFGLALGLPDEKIVLFDSEGALLMNLGVLASIAGKQPKNFVHFLLDNEVYATTGGQPVPNNANIDYAGVAGRGHHGLRRPGVRFDQGRSRGRKHADGLACTANDAD